MWPQNCHRFNHSTISERCFKYQVKKNKTLPECDKSIKVNENLMEVPAKIFFNRTNTSSTYTVGTME